MFDDSPAHQNRSAKMYHTDENQTVDYCELNALAFTIPQKTPHPTNQQSLRQTHLRFDWRLSPCKVFNTAQYTNRQSYIYGHGIVTQAAMDKMFRSDLNYQLLPAKVS
jgi:hypothetical protein